MSLLQIFLDNLRACVCVVFAQIPEESAHHVFEIFQKLNNDKDGSNGIGLSIVKKIIETHGGKIWFDSKQGQGTTFKFILPRSLEGKTPNIQS